MEQKEAVETAPVSTGTCQWCNEMGSLHVPAETAQRMKMWRGREINSRDLIQDAFPDLTAAQREQLQSGTHEKCWNEMFADLEEQ